MGHLFGGGGSPSTPPPPPPPPQIQSPQGMQAGVDAQKRATGAVGAMGSIMTGPQGLTEPASTAQKTLLGS